MIITARVQVDDEVRNAINPPVESDHEARLSAVKRTRQKIPIFLREEKADSKETQSILHRIEKDFALLR
jgi:hypothetical protein